MMAAFIQFGVQSLSEINWSTSEKLNSAQATVATRYVPCTSPSSQRSGPFNFNQLLCVGHINLYIYYCSCNLLLLGFNLTFGVERKNSRCGCVPVRVCDGCG
jgi:hypothetical protein